MCPGFILAYTWIWMCEHMHCFVHFNLNIAVIISIYAKENIFNYSGQLLLTSCDADLCLGTSVLTFQAPIRKKRSTALSNSLNKTGMNKVFYAWDWQQNLLTPRFPSFCLSTISVWSRVFKNCYLFCNTYEIYLYEIQPAYNKIADVIFV